MYQLLPMRLALAMQMSLSAGLLKPLHRIATLHLALIQITTLLGATAQGL